MGWEKCYCSKYAHSQGVGNEALGKSNRYNFSSPWSNGTLSGASVFPRYLSKHRRVGCCSDVQWSVVFFGMHRKRSRNTIGTHREGDCFMSPFPSLCPIVLVCILQLIRSVLLRRSLVLSLAACVALSLSVSFLSDSNVLCWMASRTST